MEGIKLIKIREEFHKSIKDYAKENGMKLTFCIEKAIEEYVKKHNKK